MPSTKSLDLTSELEESSDLFIIEDPETVNDCGWGTNHLYYGIRIEVQVVLMSDSQYDCISTFEGCFQVLINPKVFQTLLIPEEAGPACTDSRVGVLGFKLPPVLYIGVMYPDIAAHFCNLPHDKLRPAVAGVAYVLPVGGAQERHGRSGHDLAHVPQCVAHVLHGTQRPRVVDVDGRRGDAEVLILEAHKVTI